MDNMFDNGFAEVIPRNESTKQSKCVWFITHHAVRHKQKKKLRVVFNCALKFHGVSINDNLIAGPGLTSTLFGVLLRFRHHPIAVMADIRKMFHQVRVPTRQIDLLRFFWFDGTGENIVECRILVHVFGAVSSPSVAQYALKETAKPEHLSNATSSSIRNNFSVDDLLKSFINKEAAAREVPQLMEALEHRGFTLTCFNSNCCEVLGAVSEDRLSPTVVLPSEDPGRALGVIWNTEKDTLGYKIAIEQSQNNVTKRNLLRILTSIYDPHGFATPAILDGKRLFQESCKLHIQWDESITENLMTAWTKWIEDILHLTGYEIPRCIIGSSAERYELHTFADGSEKAYGCVSYLKCYNSNGTSSISLVASKSRLTPLNNSTLKTIPRIELSAAKLATSQSLKIQSELEIELDRHFWSDSMTVLSYIKSETLRFARFVSNKVAYIRSYSDVENWRYVNTKNNPADLTSRGCSTKKLISSNLWNNGPDFLQGSWTPAQEEFTFEISENDNEVYTKTTVLTSVMKDEPLDILMRSCSSWYKLRTRVASLMLLQKGFKKKVRVNSEISVENILDAENEIIHYLQRKHYESEITNCRNNTNLSKNSPLRKLSPFLDKNGLLRVGGRISRSQLSSNAKHPVIVPPTFIAELILRDIHLAAGHLGREVILSMARNKYHIVRANTLARKVCNECVICRKVNGKPLSQVMADLPETRVVGDHPPFTNTGIDYFGPFIIKHGRKTEKRCGVIDPKVHPKR